MASEVRFVSEFDLYLFGIGQHRRPWEALGSHWGRHDRITGTHFATWAPRARAVAVIGDMNGWVPEEAYHLKPLGESGVWEGFIAGASPGQRYKYRIVGPDGAVHEKADPYAAQSAEPPSSGSVIAPPSRHVFEDSAWMEARGHWLGDKPVSIYEVHLGSLRRDPRHPDEPLSYAKLAEFLIDYVGELGFTHVEVMPITEHPFYGSWGYQTTSYYAPTMRYGLPDELRAFVDRLHQAGIGVICDWAPAHFPRDPYALADFDGQALYEKSDPRMASHADWGTLVFDYARPQVRSFLIGSALYLIEQFHFDALRVDAVASMLYLDYSRSEYVPNPLGGREDLDAIAFLKEMNEAVHELGATTIAEESTAFPKVARPTYEGGLGFGFKWNMGWMHDTLAYLSRDAAYRSWHHDEITFGLYYAFSENFVLPLSHDESVHGKGSVYTKMAGDKWTKLATVRALYAWMWAHPGKKLLFMGDEFAQVAEWSHERSLDWHLLEDPAHDGVRRLVADLNRLYRSYPELHTADLDPRGFGWIRAADRDRNLFVTMRRVPGVDSGTLVCVANFSGMEWRDIPIGVPKAGTWIEILNTDSRHYGGSGVGNMGEKVSEPQECDGYPNRLVISIAANSAIWFFA